MVNDIQESIDILNEKLNTIPMSPNKYIELKSKREGYEECLTIINMHIDCINNVLSAVLYDKLNREQLIHKDKKPLLEGTETKEQ